MKSLFSKIFRLPVYVHLPAVGVASLLAVYLVLKFLDLYTNHNQAVLVPDIRNLQIEDAAPFLEQNSLHYTIIDSIYSKDVLPGAIVDLSPEANSKVKKNRTIYITINAKSNESAPIPDLTNVSSRLAYATLKSRRFKEVDLKYVPGEYRDLTIGIELNGALVDAGTRVPLTAKLTIVVSNGVIEPLEGDSIIEVKPENFENDESWF